LFRFVRVFCEPSCLLQEMERTTDATLPWKGRVGAPTKARSRASSTRWGARRGGVKPDTQREWRGSPHPARHLAPRRSAARDPPLPGEGGRPSYLATPIAPTRHILSICLKRTISGFSLAGRCRKSAGQPCARNAASHPTFCARRPGRAPLVARAGTHNPGQWLWVPGLAGQGRLARDDGRKG
jgi:hypothetical protein